MRRVLVTALALCANRTLKSKTRRFLAGLSCDELQFFAEFLGASILEEDCKRPGSRAQLAERIAEFQKARYCCDPPPADHDHKMILLLEFLCLSGLESVPVAVRARKH